MRFSGSPKETFTLLPLLPITNVDRFIEKAKKYTYLTGLTPELLLIFIAKVVVGEKAEKYSRTAVQDIWIHYRDIGMLNDVKEEFDIPSMEEFYGMDNGMMFDDELPATIYRTAKGGQPELSALSPTFLGGSQSIFMNIRLYAGALLITYSVSRFFFNAAITRQPTAEPITMAKRYPKGFPMVGRTKIPP